MLRSDMALDLLAGTQSRTQASPDVTASALKRRSAFTQRVLRRATDLTPYNLTIGASPAFVWYRNAKVCTRSIYAALVESDIDFIAEHAGGIRIPPAMLSGRFSFAFVRDPRTRLLSCWRNKVLDDTGFGVDASMHDTLRDFNGFVAWVADQDLTSCDRHYRLQSRLIDVPRIEFIGRFERFAEDFALVCERLGIAPTVGHKNASAPRDVTLTPQVKSRIEELYREDFETFSYE